MRLDFKTWLLVQETLDANAEAILRKINASYATRGQGHLDAADIETLVQQLKDLPQAVDVDAAKQQLHAKLNIQAKPTAPAVDTAIRQAQKLYKGPELESFLRQYKNKSIQQDELLVAAYFFRQGASPNLVIPIMQDVNFLKSKKAITSRFEKIPYVNQQPIADFNDYVSKVHELKSGYEYERTKHTLVQANAPTPPIAVSPDGTISIYLADSHKKCILHGKGTTFCISSKSSPQWYYEYRFEYGQTQYFIIDKNQKSPADLVNAGVAPPPPGFYSEWVDRRNRPNDIAGFNSVDDYKKYLSEKFNVDIDTILKPIPLTQEEIEIKKIADLLGKRQPLPEEIFANPERLLLVLHLGYNLRPDDFARLPESYKEVYFLNLENLKQPVECQYLVQHPDLLAKWYKEQDDIDNVEIFRLLMYSGNAVETAKLLQSLDSSKLANVEPEKDVFDYGLVNEDTFEEYVKLAIYLDNEVSKGAVWRLLWRRPHELEVSWTTLKKGAIYVIENKKEWEEDDIYTLFNMWSDYNYEWQVWSDTIYEVPATVLVGRDISKQLVHDILYITNADPLVKAALGHNMDKLLPQDLQQLKKSIDDKGAP